MVCSLLFLLALEILMEFEALKRAEKEEAKISRVSDAFCQ